jgi:hypothetical protein
MTGTMSRRDMLALLSAGLTLAVLSPARTLGALPRPLHGTSEEASLAQWVNEQLGDADVTALAAAWTRSHPAERSRAVVERMLLQSRNDGEALDVSLARRIADEHAAGRSERVDGWYLAPTEARLLVLLQSVRSGVR